MKRHLFLSALAASAVTAVGCAGTMAEGQPSRSETAGELLDDASITTAAKAAIVGDPDARLLKIVVTTTRGEVLLEGLVNTRDAETRLLAKIRAMKGVRSVRSNLQVEEKKS
jgi:osmotically-inducible protein OsmY